MRFLLQFLEDAGRRPLSSYKTRRERLHRPDRLVCPLDLSREVFGGNFLLTFVIVSLLVFLEQADGSPAVGRGVGAGERLAPSNAPLLLRFAVRDGAPALVPLPPAVRGTPRALAASPPLDSAAASFWGKICVVRQSLPSRSEASAARDAHVTAVAACKGTCKRSAGPAPSSPAAPSPAQVSWALYSPRSLRCWRSSGSRRQAVPLPPARHTGRPPCCSRQLGQRRRWGWGRRGGRRRL